MKLEPTSTPFEPVNDRRLKVVVPPPVNLAAVADVTLPGISGAEKELDEFYVGLLRFERDESAKGLVYRAENFRLKFDMTERPGPRDDFRPVGVIVPSLEDLVVRLNEAEIAFTRRRGINVGEVTLGTTDPAGNFVEVTESRRLL